MNFEVKKKRIQQLSPPLPVQGRGMVKGHQNEVLHYLTRRSVERMGVEIFFELLLHFTDGFGPEAQVKSKFCQKLEVEILKMFVGLFQKDNSFHQKMEQRRVGFFFAQGFDQHFGHKQGNA